MVPIVIFHCRQTDMPELLRQLEEAGYRWNGDGKRPTELTNFVGNYIYVYNSEGKFLRYSNSCPTDKYVEFHSFMRVSNYIMC